LGEHGRVLTACLGQPPRGLSRISELGLAPAVRGDYTAKDFRTWHATVLAAVGLAVSEPAAGRDAFRKRAIARVVAEVAGYLGNTPAVARASYIDPRVIDLYEQGRTIAPVLGDLGKGRDFGDLATRDHAEKALVKLLAGARS
jgi:DNA topoisomerase IB